MAELSARAIPASGEPLPVIGLGTWQVLDVGRGERERAGPRAVLRDLVAAGARLVDTSPMYGRAEEVLGDLVAELGIRDRLFLATKVWTSGRRRGIEQMEASLRKLRVPQVDLMQVHNLVDVDTHLPTLRQWKEAGRVRYLGITHFTASAHAEVEAVLRREPVDFLQINYSVAEREAERRLLPLALERGIAVIANRPLATGALMRALAGKTLPPWLREAGVASWAQALLAFVVGHPAVTCAIPATGDPLHLREDLAAAFAPPPDDELRERIARAAQT